MDILGMVIVTQKKHAPLKRFYLEGNYVGIYLTSREMECAYELIQGCTAKQIAKTMKISPRTVEDYIFRLKLKFHVNSQSGLIKKIMECKVFNKVEI